MCFRFGEGLGNERKERREERRGRGGLKGIQGEGSAFPVITCSYLVEYYIKSINDDDVDRVCKCNSKSFSG